MGVEDLAAPMFTETTWPVLELRDRFACAALVGILPRTPLSEPAEVIAGRCYIIADAMLAEKGKRDG